MTRRINSRYEGWGFTVYVDGANRAIKKLLTINKGSVGAIARSTIAGAGVFKKAAGPASPIETGLLARSWRVKRVRSRQWGRIAYRVSPNPRVKRATRRYFDADAWTWKTEALTERRRKLVHEAGGAHTLGFRQPLRYAHLVELGHDIVKGGSKARSTRRVQSGIGARVVGHVAGRHFLKKMYRTNETSALRAIIARAEKEYRRLASK